MKLKEDGALSKMVQTHSFIHALYYYETLDSTNAIAVNQRMSGGTLILSDYQTAGKGRLNRSWESNPAEDILMSLVLEPHGSPDVWARISFPLGLAIREALSLSVPSNTPIKLKWPNDILIENKKCVGMLHAADASKGRVILGLGINVNQSPQTNDRTSLKMVTGRKHNRWEILNDVLTAIGTHLDALLSATIDVDVWNTHAAYYGKQVQVFDQQLIKGKFLGIDAEGAALIQTKNFVKRVLRGGNFRKLPH